MQYWVFKIEDAHILDQLQQRREDINLSLEWGYNFQGHSGDKVIFLCHEREWMFQYEGIISEEPKVKLLTAPDEKKLYRIEITFSSISAIDVPNLLSDYTYTLTKITNYDNAIKHFRRYSRVSFRDYSSVINGQVFISRTFFGKVVNSLPLEHKRNFLNRLMQLNPDLYLQGSDYLTAFRLLKEYISENIIIPARLLKQAVTWLDNVHPDAGPLFFVSDIIDEHSSQRPLFNIREKAQQVSGNEEENEMEFLTTVEDEIRRASQSETGLNNSFNKRTLPIDF